MRLLAVLSALLAPLPLAAAPACAVDPAAVEARIAGLEAAYPLVLSDIGCEAPALPAHVILCDAAEAADPTLWRMARLDDLAWVHAVENATGQQVDQVDPPRDAAFVARRDACRDIACLCDVLVAHTDDSLGGTSPYAR
ncbi:hypothetical protein LHP98_04525 [Rhodobacter sp. Har01]|uniref:hypothetical protein n=1 Tax=Rhodobacter sp. Har01 TaxID=2883999 RepID=UPI001D093CE4|nr:hypothetical protein [Rhodobacter sp. Har01]MCB6177394.1 hypothetical protein [Rhodobacter sp. Har01]